MLFINFNLLVLVAKTERASAAKIVKFKTSLRKKSKKNGNNGNLTCTKELNLKLKENV